LQIRQIKFCQIYIFSAPANSNSAKSAKFSFRQNFFPPKFLPRLPVVVWKLFGHCFDCQIKVENKLRIDGKYEEWAKEKIKKNKISFIKDSIQKIEEFKNQSAPEFFNQVGVNYPELEKEKWDIDMKKVHKEADQALKKYTEVLEKLEESE